MSLTTRTRRGLAGALATVLTAGGLIASASPSQAAQQDVTGVQFRWGFNNESGNTGAAPGTVNLFSAGKIGNPTEGGQQLNGTTQGATWSNGKPAGWSAQSGNVRIEKRRADNSFARATWAGLRTDKDGASLGNYASNTKFSGHEVVISDGAGTIDPVADDASIAWDGDFTVVYYSGYTFFYVTDPQLTVDNGVGTVTATLSGYGSSMDDMSQWQPLTPKTVTLATVKNVDVTDDGLVVTPEYANVSYTAPSDGTPQNTTGTHPGAFPQSFVDYLQATGAGPYWYSTGGAVDKNKYALPLTVDRTPAAPIDPVDPVVTPPVVTPPVVTPPVSPPAATRAATARPVVKVAKRPTSKKAGKATITVKSKASGAKPSGTAKVTITKGKTKKTVTVTVKNGKATVKLPKLKKGTWKLRVSYAGSATQAPSTSKTYKVKAS